MQCACAILSSVDCSVLRYFSTSSHKWNDFREKKLLNINAYFNFLYNFFWKISHSKKKWMRNDQNDQLSSYKVPVMLVRLQWNLNSHDSFFEKYSNIKFHDNPSSGSRVVPYGQTDERAEMTKLIVVFRNSANAPKTLFSCLLCLCLSYNFCNKCLLSP